MQKKIIALAIAAAFAAPVAMAEVTVYGSVDAGVRSDTGAGKTSTTFGVASGSYNSNRFGIKASEDMGGGMKTNVVLEGSLDMGNGGSANPKTTTNNTDVNNQVSLFDRQATVGISSGAHAVDLGRQYSVAFKTVGLYDPLAFKFIKIGYGEAAAINTRFNNDIAYTGKFGDITVTAEHNIPSATYASDNSATGATTTAATGDDSTATTAVGVGYASGPVTVGGAYSMTKAAVATNLADTKYYTVGAAYNFGDGKVSLGYANNTVAAAVSGGNDTVTKFTFLGASYNVSSSIGVVAAVYKKVVTVAADVTDTKMVIGATYALSKATKMYVEADKNSNDNGTTTTDTNGYCLGLSTAF